MAGRKPNQQKDWLRRASDYVPSWVDRRRVFKISINVVIQICRNLIKRFCKSIEDALSNAYAPNLGSGGGKTNCLCVLEVGLDGRDHDASFNRE